MRPYTGYDRTAGAITPGLQRLIDYCQFLTGGGLWNNGAFGVRDMRGKPGKPSVHATGRAVDLSWRKLKSRPAAFGAYQPAADFIQFLVDHADELMLEMVIDYHPKPHGRGWRCDRGAWQIYTSKTVSGAPGGDWFHLEISPRMAQNPAFYDQAFRHILNIKD